MVVNRCRCTGNLYENDAPTGITSERTCFRQLIGESTVLDDDEPVTFTVALLEGFTDENGLPEVFSQDFCPNILEKKADGRVKLTSFRID